MLGRMVRKRELHGVSLGRGFAGNQDTQRQRNEEVRQREKREQQDIAMYRHVKKIRIASATSSCSARRNLSPDTEAACEQQSHGADGSDEELLKRAAFLFPHDGKRGEKGRHV